MEAGSWIDTLNICQTERVFHIDKIWPLTSMVIELLLPQINMTLSDCHAKPTE